MPICPKCNKEPISQFISYTENKSIVAVKICLDCFTKLATQEQIQQEIKRLRISCYFHKQLYYRLDDPILDDWNYDRLEKKCIYLEDLAPFEMEYSPRNNIGYSCPDNLKDDVFNLIRIHLEYKIEIKRLKKLINEL